MKIERTDGKLRVNILPGEYYATNEPAMIRTLLGSCVAACLYDPVNRITGMNHFLLSSRRYAKTLPVCLTDAGRYGIQAMELLINDMLKLGAKRQYLKAKAFGGGSIFLSADRKDNFYCVGDVNIRFIREFLKNDGIPIVSEDLGGEAARIVHFLSEDYSVHVKKVEIARAQKVIQEERKCWMTLIEKQEKARPQVDVWG